ncbi:glutathione S-transferase family protein [Granulosicoccus sp. 3-233]|uniref:glutathione S-transferase family protein n=1 Tax=Granulosicoccus sp. 3-233 TaxID=3417969 RepID=UPI003D33B6A3
MITIHCLAYSRAIRLLWLMEDLEQPYHLVFYERTENFRAPESLARVHPLGKSPVIQDEQLVLAESATCLRYLHDRFGDGRHVPAAGTDDHLRHEELLDYVESSFASVAMQLLLPHMRGDEPTSAAYEAMQKHQEYIVHQLPEKGLLFGDMVSLADMQFSYLLANLSRSGFLEDAPRLAAYWQHMQMESGYRAAITHGGPMAPER